MTTLSPSAKMSSTVIRPSGKPLRQAATSCFTPSGPDRTTWPPAPWTEKLPSISSSATSRWPCDQPSSSQRRITAILSLYTDMRRSSLAVVLSDVQLLGAATAGAAIGGLLLRLRHHLGHHPVGVGDLSRAALAGEVLEIRHRHAGNAPLHLWRFGDQAVDERPGNLTADLDEVFGQSFNQRPLLLGRRRDDIAYKTNLNDRHFC